MKLASNAFWLLNGAATFFICVLTGLVLIHAPGGRKILRDAGSAPIVGFAVAVYGVIGYKYGGIQKRAKGK